MAKKSEKESKRVDKDALFNNFFDTADLVLNRFEFWFSIDDIRERVFGVKLTGPYGTFESEKQVLVAKENVRSSRAWAALSALYDYAVDGIAGDAEPTDIVIDGAEILSFITTENYQPMEEWDMIVARGDGRFCLDDEEDIHLDKLALLAEVDIRTVRNAISAGELSAVKRNDIVHPGIYVDNSTARRWLQGRRGFKPTVFHGRASQHIEHIGSPSEFGAFLTARRNELGLDVSENKLVPLCPGVDAKSIVTIEAGVFALPLSAVNPIADFYQLNRKTFLSCVMRVFFGDYLATIRESLASE